MPIRAMKISMTSPNVIKVIFTFRHHVSSGNKVFENDFSVFVCPDSPVVIVSSDIEFNIRNISIFCRLDYFKSAFDKHIFKADYGCLIFLNRYGLRWLFLIF